jgi:hypothetical protein
VAWWTGRVPRRLRPRAPAACPGGAAGGYPRPDRVATGEDLHPILMRTQAFQRRGRRETSCHGSGDPGRACPRVDRRGTSDDRIAGVATSRPPGGTREHQGGPYAGRPGRGGSRAVGRGPRRSADGRRAGAVVDAMCPDDLHVLETGGRKGASNSRRLSAPALQPVNACMSALVAVQRRKASEALGAGRTSWRSAVRWSQSDCNLASCGSQTPIEGHWQR